MGPKVRGKDQEGQFNQGGVGEDDDGGNGYDGEDDDGGESRIGGDDVATDQIGYKLPTIALRGH